MNALLNKLLAAAAGIALLSMMFLMFVDVVARYFFNTPVTGGHSVIKSLMVILVFSALPLITIKGKHITVELMDDMFKGSLRLLRDILIHIVSLSALTVLAVQLWWQGGYFAGNDEVLESINIPIYIFAYFMSVMTALTVGIQVTLLAKLISEFWQRKKG